MESLLGYRVANMQGIGSRERQEDSYALANASDADKIAEEGLLFAVFDGMGGMRDGKLAGETAAASIQEAFRELDRDGDLVGQLKKAFYTASGEVKKKTDGKGGSTAVVGIIYREKLYFASVGDSFLYLRRDGELCRLNTEHNVCHEEYLSGIRKGEIDPEACRSVTEAGALTQFLGREDMDEVDICLRPLHLKKGDVLLACSDGLGGVLNEEEIMNSLSFKSERAMRQQLTQYLTLHENPAQDNYTAVIVKCEGVS